MISTFLLGIAAVGAATGGTLGTASRMLATKASRAETAGVAEASVEKLEQAILGEGEAARGLGTAKGFSAVSSAAGTAASTAAHQKLQSPHPDGK